MVFAGAVSWKNAATGNCLGSNGTTVVVVSDNLDTEACTDGVGIGNSDVYWNDSENSNGTWGEESNYSGLCLDSDTSGTPTPISVGTDTHRGVAQGFPDAGAYQFRY